MHGMYQLNITRMLHFHVYDIEQLARLTALTDHYFWLVDLHDLLHHRLEQQLIGLVIYPISQGNIDGIILAPAPSTRCSATGRLTE